MHLLIVWRHSHQNMFEHHWLSNMLLFMDDGFQSRNHISGSPHLPQENKRLLGKGGLTLGNTANHQNNLAVKTSRPNYNISNVIIPAPIDGGTESSLHRQPMAPGESKTQ